MKIINHVLSDILKSHLMHRIAIIVVQSVTAFESNNSHYYLELLYVNTKF